MARVAEMALLAVVQNGPAARDSEAVMLVAYKAAALSNGRVSEEALLVASASEPAARVSETAVLVAYKTGVGGLVRSRAWTFSLDGHAFYVLNLSEEGTFVFDDRTREWSQFQTGGYGVWNMIQGFEWGLYVVGGDAIYPKVWAIAPDSAVDEDWRPVEHKVNGGIPSRSVDGVTHDALLLTASAGFVGENGATIQMRFSDDQGRTWSDYYDVVLESGNYSQQIMWRSLGTFSSPGRVIEIRDIGGNIRLDDTVAIIDGEE